MIKFTPRESETAPTPPPGEYSLFMTTDGSLALKSSEGAVTVLAVVSDIAEDSSDTLNILRGRLLAGFVDGCTLGVENVVDRRAPGNVAAPGFRGMPTNSQNGAYTFALTDAGICVANLAGGWTIPANASVSFPVDTIIMLRNDSSSTQSLAITTDTLRQAGTTNTGTRTVAAYGVATIEKVSATEWRCWGNLT